MTNLCEISEQALRRMPYYLQYLNELRLEGREFVPASQIAEALKLSDVQVRKDFAAVSVTGGRPRAGFLVDELIDSIEQILGYRNINEAVLVGVGHLGQALLNYHHIEDYGVQIVAAFDTDREKIGSKFGNIRVFPADSIARICRRLSVKLGIITTPVSFAEEVSEQLIQGGILGIWNFTNVHLQAPEHIFVQNENIAESLALLSRHLRSNH